MLVLLTNSLQTIDVTRIKFFSEWSAMSVKLCAGYLLNFIGFFFLSYLEYFKSAANKCWKIFRQ
jgi:hypothetical protein